MSDVLPNGNTFPGPNWSCGFCGHWHTGPCIVWTQHFMAPPPLATAPLPPMPAGWACPRCGVVHAPHVERCDCKPDPLGYTRGGGAAT